MPYEILVQNVPKTIDAYELACLFKAQGRIVSCHIDLDERSTSLGSGTIAFLKPSSAHDAVRDKDGYKFMGHKLRVSLKLDDFRDEIRSIEENFTRVHVKNLPDEWDDEALRREFVRFGDVKTAHVSFAQDGKSNGYGFVVFDEHSSALSAVDDPDWDVQPYLPKSLRRRTLTENSVVQQQQNNLHVKGLPRTMDDWDLEMLFHTFGEIKNTKVERDEEGNSRCFGYVCFRSEADARKACGTMDGLNLDGKRLCVNFFQRMDERKKGREKSKRNKH